MELSSILHVEAVKTLSAVTSKKRLLQEIGDIAAAAYDLPAADICHALQERETLGPTGVGHGIALPHARIPGLTKVHGAFVRVEKALDFESVDRQPVDLVFALLAPQDAGVDHLKALAMVSRTMRDTSLCSKLRANSDPATLHTLLTEAPSVPSRLAG
ncbi:MAG: PTS sugar transporter subunit IIA [Paracoccaceae bacterium]|nr:PTS sugar transporter subunit IIA [Paracoccaceae bacterium]